MSEVGAADVIELLQDIHSYFEYCVYQGLFESGETNAPAVSSTKSPADASPFSGSSHAPGDPTASAKRPNPALPARPIFAESRTVTSNPSARTSTQSQAFGGRYGPATLADLGIAPTGDESRPASTVLTGQRAPEEGDFRAKSNARQLREIQDVLGDCRRCSLGASRDHIYFGQGSPTPEVMVVVENPSLEVEQTRDYYAGAAGELLKQIIQTMLHLTIDQIYLTFVAKCHSHAALTSDAEPVRRCMEFTFKQMQVLRPKLLLTFGEVASQSVLNTRESIDQMRGKLHTVHGIGVLPTLSPEQLLVDKSLKRQVFVDMSFAGQYLARFNQSDNSNLE